jgi:hypothetical protein
LVKAARLGFNRDEGDKGDKGRPIFSFVIPDITPAA